MPKKVLKGLVLAITIIFITLTFSGCDQIMDLLGIDSPEGPGGSGGPHTDPIEIPASVDQNATYVSYEAEFLTDIDTERSTVPVTQFNIRDSNLDALARRYARADACDPIPENLKSRVSIEIGSCSDAAFFIGGSNTLSSFVDINISNWLAGPNGPNVMHSPTFTKIGIGMAEVPEHAGIAPGEKWHSVVVLFVKP
ncbi:MAG: hypothetical protein Q8O15_01555 [Rectinemataceae bacterium]|nr:hypothetical protein [Rectinemataceae bacterium]